MRSTVIAYLLLFITSSLNAQILPLDRDAGPGSDEGTLTCKTEQAMVNLMNAQAEEQVLLARLIISGDCLIMPRGWVILLAEDPPPNERQDHASKWTIRTPDGIVHMWSTPVDED